MNKLIKLTLFQDIRCDEKDFVVAYTEGDYKHLVGKDVKTFDDLIADERLPGLQVKTSVRGSG